MPLDTTTAWAKIKDFLSNFRHDCDVEIAHIESELGIEAKKVEEVAAPIAETVEATAEKVEDVVVPETPEVAASEASTESSEAPSETAPE